MGRLLILLFFVHAGYLLLSQDLGKEFARFKNAQANEFLQEVQRQDSLFALAIRENWKSFELNRPYEYLPEYPKPEVQPQNRDNLKQINYPTEPTSQKLRSFKPVIYEETEFYSEEDNAATFDFYGQACELKWVHGVF